MDLETMLKTRSNQPVYYAFAVSFVFYILLKFFLGSFWVAIVGNLIFYSPLIVLAVIFFLIYRKNKDFPEEKHIVRRHYLILALKLLAVILAFHLIYAPGTLIPLIISLTRIIRAFFTLDSFFFFFSYFFIVIIAGSLILLLFRTWQKSQGKYEGSIPVLSRRIIYGIFFLCFLFLGTSVSAFPKAYKPFTDTLGNVIYNFSGGKVQMNGTDPTIYKRIGSIKAAASEIASSLSLTKSNLTDSLQEKSASFTSDLTSAQSALTSSIKDTKNNLEDQLDDDLGDKLNKSGGTISGDLTVEDDLTIEGIINAEGGIDLGSNTLSISGTTLITNLNADLLDGHHWSEIPDGVTDHSLLTNLAYASSGHTGFEPTVTKGNLTASSSKISIGGTGTGALIGSGATVDVAEANLTHNNLGGLTTGNPHTQYVLYSGATDDVDLGSHSLTADGLDINGSSQFDGTVTIGVDDTGYDVKLYGATAGKYLLWDESLDGLRLEGTMGIGTDPVNTIPIQLGGDYAQGMNFGGGPLTGADVYLMNSSPYFTPVANNSKFTAFRLASSITGSATGLTWKGVDLYPYIISGAFNGTMTSVTGIYFSGYVGTTVTDFKLIDFFGNLNGAVTNVRGMHIRPQVASLNSTNYFGIQIAGSFSESTITTYYGMKIGGTFIFEESGSIGTYYGIKIDNVPTTTTAGYAIYTGTGKVHFGDNVGIGIDPSYPLDVKAAGTGVIARFQSDNVTGCSIAADGTISCSSDRELKKNIEDINYGLSILLSLDPVEYNWKSESDKNSKSLGFIAQDVEKLIPKLVTTDADGYKQLNAIGLVPVIVKSIQELASSANDQQSQIIGLADNQNEISKQLTGQLADQELSIGEKINLIGENLDELNNDQIETIKEQLEDLQDEMEGKISKDELETYLAGYLKDQWGSVMSFASAITDGEDGNINLNLVDGKIIAGNIEAEDITLSGQLTAQDIEALGTIKAEDVEATNNIEAGKEIKGDVFELSADSSGKAVIEAGETEVEIETPYADEEAKIYLTPKNGYEKIYYNDEDIDDEKSFKVKIDEAADHDIEFNWMIVK